MLLVQLVLRSQARIAFIHTLTLKTMSITNSNAITKNYRGMFGKQVVFRNRFGQSIMAIPPKKPSTGPTENQVNARRRFLLASRYAKNILQDPDMLAAYAARSHDGFSPYILAMTDFLKPPFVAQIDATHYHGNTGEKIVITAGDDFAVTGLNVTLADAEGIIIEQGAGVLNQVTGNYDYTITQSVSETTGMTITATVTDTPGHTAELSVTL